MKEKIKKVIEKLPSRTRLMIISNYLIFRYGSKYIGNEVKIIKMLSNKKKVSLDIGANAGILAMFMRKYANHLYCFEPLPWLSEKMIRDFDGLNVTVECCALGNINDKYKMKVPFIEGRRVDTRSSLILDFNYEQTGEKIDKVEEIAVQVRRLDDFKIRNIGFIKIDVEGYEVEVIKGGEHTILENKPNLMVEIEQRYHKTEIKEIFAKILKMGYEGYFFSDGKRKSIWEFDPPKVEAIRAMGGKYINNFIFIPHAGACLS